MDGHESVIEEAWKVKDEINGLCMQFTEVTVTDDLESELE